MSRIVNHDKVDLEGWILSAKSGFSSSSKEYMRFFSKWFIIRDGTLHYYPNTAVQKIISKKNLLLESHPEKIR
jgi:hypothetical protein